MKPITPTSFTDLLIVLSIAVGIIAIARLFIEIDIWRLKRIIKKQQEKLKEPWKI